MCSCMFEVMNSWKSKKSLKFHWKYKKRWSVTFMELFKKHVFYCRVLAFLKSWIRDDFKKHWIYIVISIELLIHLDGVIQNACDFGRFFILLKSCWPLIFENLNISLEVCKNMIPGGGKPRVWNSSSPVVSFKAY